MLQSSGPISIGDIFNEVYGSYPSPGDVVSLAELLTHFPSLSQSQPIPLSRFYGASALHIITVYISWSDNGASSGNYNVTFTASQNVDADLTINFTVEDDISNNGAARSVVMNNGTSSVNATGTLAVSIGVFTNLTIDSFSPSSTIDQTYST